MKKIYIADLQSGDKISGEQFAIKDIKKGKTQDGRDYLDVILSDKTGEINGKVWTDDMANFVKVAVGDIAEVSAKVGEYRDRQQLTISFAVKAEEYQIEDFLPASTKDLDYILQSIDKSVKKVKDKNLRTLLESFFDNDEFRKSFRYAPAAEKVHHAYLGGLAEHVFEMLAIAEVITVNYPEINADLLITGILLHDIGKLSELGVTHAIYRTVAGNLMSHITLGAILVSEHMAMIKNFPDELKAKVEHLILSHHGQLDFGSPVRPMTREAWALAQIDNLSAKVNTVCRAITAQSDSGQDFSDYNYFLETKLYLK